ncbi:MAG: D-alanyl-D-alanine carboxypeptidase family protein [Parcubacteria group bacterium GW2011_GWA2_43_11]|nr:MAG: D-alanyl-D-alanine carboxypeptidase family protein [Parcubacteria group bacterium GW2011_GWA2_43_11]
MNDTPKHSLAFWIVFILILLLVAGFIMQAYFMFTLSQKLNIVSQNNASTTNAFTTFSSTTLSRFEENEKKFVQFSDMLYEEQQVTVALTDAVDKFKRQVGKLTGTVDTLEKLTTTDPELLQKYSRIYFLNEHYKPADLSFIEEKFDYVNGKEVTISSEVLPFLSDLLEEAEDDGVDLIVLSGYRSFTEQGTLKNVYTTNYGVGANRFSADQGYSEHQLGTAVDFTSTTIGENLSAFESSEAHTWLLQNAHKYGFVMSYPENNEFYVYEPWHWRFVGKKLARYLDREAKNFYDIEQRDIDTYITSLFD